MDLKTLKMIHTCGQSIALCAIQCIVPSEHVVNSRCCPESSAFPVNNGTCTSPANYSWPLRPKSTALHTIRPLCMSTFEYTSQLFDLAEHVSATQRSYGYGSSALPLFLRGFLERRAKGKLAARCVPRG
jgi:hypothetical protein